MQRLFRLYIPNTVILVMLVAAGENFWLAGLAYFMVLAVALPFKDVLRFEMAGVRVNEFSTLVERESISGVGGR